MSDYSSEREPRCTCDAPTGSEARLCRYCRQERLNAENLNPGRKMQRNEFPVRLDIKAISDIASKCADNEVFVKVNHVLPRVSNQEQQLLRNTAAVLIAFQEYLKERHVDPGFQVVINE